MSEVNLGQTPETLGIRDAVHVAMIAVEAGEKLKAGQRVGVENGVAHSGLISVGIVDPFLTGSVTKGSAFWLVLFPNTVRGMRHHWSHPAFKDDDIRRGFGFSKKESEEWLQQFVQDNSCPSYDVLITAATGGELPNRYPEYYRSRYTLDENYLHFSGDDAHGDIPPEFWDHVENVTGLPCPVRPDRFSCSC